MHGIDEGELEIGPLGYYASSLLYCSYCRKVTHQHVSFGEERYDIANLLRLSMFFFKNRFLAGPLGRG
jgi:hypothetical protein